jgi:hypothetical protein
MKCTPVRTPRGSAFIRHRLGRDRRLQAVNGEIGTVHAAKIAPAAFLGIDDMRRMIALGIESRGKGEDLGGTEFHTKATGLAALNNYVDASFCHLNPHGCGAVNTPRCNFDYRI